MHGIPWNMVKNATRDQLNIFWEIVKRDEKDKFDFDNSATMVGVAKAFGGKS